MSTRALMTWREEYRRKIVGALIASVLIHFFLILLVPVIASLRPPVAVPPAEETPVELTIVAPPKSEPKQPSYVETSESQRTDKPPEDAPFESDKDTQAASALPATGDAPVPTQDGHESPALSLENKEYTAGPQARPSTPAAQPRQEAAPEPKIEPQAPPKFRQSENSQLALLDPPKPKTTPRPQPEKAVQRQQQQEERTQNAEPPGYQPQTRVTRLRGSISNRGRAAVNAAATPRGRYLKMLSDAIGSRWYYYMSDQVGLINVGTVEIRFVVRENGKVERVQVLRNTSNESLAACSVRAIMEAEIPPIPKELVPMLQGGGIEIEYSFTRL